MARVLGKHGQAKGLFLALLLSFALMMTGCGAEDVASDLEGTSQEEGQEEEQTETGGSQDVGYPLTMTDGVGNELTLEEEPQTIVSTLPSNTEIAYALGLGDKMIGVSEWCNYPEEALDVDKVGDMDVDEETVLMMAPDLLLASEHLHNQSPDVLDTFREAGINVLVVADASSFEEAYESIELIAQATGTVERAEEVVDNMKEKLTSITEKADSIDEEARVWVEISPAPDIFTSGSGTFIHEMLEYINAENAAGHLEGWPNLTEEEIVELNPDVIVTTYGYYVEQPKEEVLGREGWAHIPAIENERVYDVDNDTVTRPGPRLVDGVETLATIIYPEVFGE
ncbi:ABC transporter substrate-binding protein [Caldalkalibacillus salinus]|uniref:ABC transporter substrate-binding protein n=1 Tax=Caldalkalibacillus salinus TaxID=2803787 RepID=UPI0019230F83|nr:ABC transporter substrate-binding protein [Caldalkalibacillus salinus]